MITRGLHPFGIEVKAIDLRRVTAEDCHTLVDLLGQHGVVIVCGQHVSDHEFAEFLSRLGPLTFTKGETAVAHCTNLIQVGPACSTPHKAYCHAASRAVELT